VRTIRIWLLVLLAVMLSARGAVAAAMLCPPASESGPETVLMAGSGMNHRVMDVVEHASHEHADHQTEHAESGADAPASGGHHDGFGKCNLCCDVCSMTPLLSTLPAVPTPPSLFSVSFPHLFAPAPSFLSDGQERPPRSI
jgi:hypothetical protein